MLTSRFAIALLLSISCSTPFAFGLDVPTKEQMMTLLPELNKKLKAYPKDFESLMLRALVNKNLGNYRPAIEDLTLALSAHPSKKRDVLWSRSLAYFGMKDIPHALADANALVAAAPDYIAYSNRGCMYLSMKQFQKATQDYSMAARLNPRFAPAWEGLGEISYRAGQYQKAVDYCSSALNFDNGMLDALYFRGKALQALGKVEQGTKDVEKALAAGYSESVVLTRYAN